MTVEINNEPLSPELLKIQQHKTLRNNLITYSERRAKEDFLTFVRMFAPTLVDPFFMGRHIELICQKLQGVVTEKNKRLMVFLPPRSSKSVICSKLFPAWYIGNFSNHEIMSVSHSDQLAADFGGSVRDIVKTDKFKKVFKGVTLSTDSHAKGKWKTNKNGSYYAAGVRSQVAGRGAHVALLDDVMSEEDSFSDAGRKRVKEWYPAGLRSRLMPGGSIIIINTRYHYDDLCGWLLKQEKNTGEGDYPWEVISIPAWLDKKAANLLGLPEGSSYFPEWKSDKILKLDEAEIRSTNGARYWNSLYMQDPSPDDGSVFRKKWFKWWDHSEPPTCNFIIQTYDTAFSTKATADYSVIQTWGIFTSHDEEENPSSNLILLGNIRGRFEYPDLRRKAQELYDQYKPDICLIEKQASGQSLIQDMRRANLPVLDYLPDRGKRERAHASTPFMESGLLWLPKNKKYSDDLFEECITFPNAAHDDQVDCMTMAILYMRDSWNISHPEDPSWEDDVNPRRRKRVGYWRT